MADTMQYAMAYCTDVKQLVLKANEMAADGWKLSSTTDAHGFPIGIFERVAVESDEPHQVVHDMTGDGVFDINPPQPTVPVVKHASPAPAPEPAVPEPAAPKPAESFESDRIWVRPGRHDPTAVRP